jgi:hypothetical protein
MSLKRNYVIKAESTSVVSGEMQVKDLIDGLLYDLDFNPASGTADYRRISSLKLWLIDDDGALYAVPADDTNLFNGTELIPGSWGAAVDGYYQVTNAGGAARIFLSDSDGKYRIIIPALSIPASEYVTRQDSKSIVLHLEYITQDSTKGTFQIPLTLQNIGRTAYNGLI